MAIEVPTYLVRYGDYDWRANRLNEDGIRQVGEACDVLVAKKVGRGALLIAPMLRTADKTTELRPAATSAEMIVDRTGAQMVTDPEARVALENGTRHPSTLTVDAEQFLEETITGAGHNLSDHNGLVVVTRARFIGSLRGITNWATANRTIPHGHVEEYLPGTWPPLPPGGYLH